MNLSNGFCLFSVHFSFAECPAGPDNLKMQLVCKNDVCSGPFLRDLRPQWTSGKLLNFFFFVLFLPPKTKTHNQELARGMMGQTVSSMLSLSWSLITHTLYCALIQIDSQFSCSHLHIFLCLLWDNSVSVKYWYDSCEEATTFIQTPKRLQKNF